MNRHRSRGATLALVAASVIIIVMVGLALYFLARLLGGGRELQGSTDSGSLNMAKQVIIEPSVAIDINSNVNADINKILAGTMNAPHGQNINMGNGANLLSFNRMVAEAMLVALNAEADGSGTAHTNADLVIAAVEGNNANSFGSQLKAKLDPSTKNETTLKFAQDFFNSTGLSNSIRMLDLSKGGGSTDWDPAEFKAAYMDADADVGNGATNVSIDNLTAAPKASDTNVAFVGLDGQPIVMGTAMPIKDYTAGTQQEAPTGWNVAEDGKAYVKGYKEIAIGTHKIYGVPVNPNRQPHLISLQTFGARTTQPGADTCTLPPNAFQNGATAIDARTKLVAHTRAAALVGTPQAKFTASIPRGYLVIQNGGEATSNLSFQTPGTDNVAANELLTGIISTNNGYFSTDNNLMHHLTEGDRDATDYKSELQTMLDDADTHKQLFDPNGAQVTNAQTAMDQVPSGMHSRPCTDTNTSSVPICQQLAGITGSGSDPFDVAYHPDFANQQTTQITGNSLTAGEQASCELMTMYGTTPHGGGPPMAWSHNFGPTGVRLYESGLPSSAQQYAWGPTGKGFDGQGGGCNCGHSYHDKDGNTIPASAVCQVTHDGNLVDLFEQVKPGSSKDVVRFIAQRLLEIKPTLTQAELTAVLNQRLPLASTYFAYLKDGNITVSKDAPNFIAGMSEDHKKADGKTVGPPASTYSILRGMVNPDQSYNIHYLLFTTSGNDAPPQNGDYNQGYSNGEGDIKAVDRAELEVASGAYGCLGQIKFSQSTNSDGNFGFNSRD